MAKKKYVYVIYAVGQYLDVQLSLADCPLGKWKKN